MHCSFFDAEDNSRNSFELPGAKPHYNPDQPGKVEHIFLDLVLDVPQEHLQGTCTLTFVPIQGGITHLTLDAVGLNIEAVQIEEISQPFSYDGERLLIELSKPLGIRSVKIMITYNLRQPQRGIYFIAPNAHYPQKPTQVWTQGEDEDSRFWFPCFDYPGQLTTSEIRVTIPKPLIAVSNGELLGREDLGEKQCYHWLQKQPHPSYLIALAVGDFAEVKEEWRGIDVSYYVEKGREEQAKISMGKTPHIMEFLSQKYGYLYPYPKYAQVCVDDFIFGGMENTSVTLLTDRCLLDARAALDDDRTETLVVHELAHQWFGDLVGIKHWSHAWIKEGAASYSEAQWIEEEYGKDDGAYYLLNEARNYLNEDKSRYRRPIVTNVYRDAIELYDRHLYEKGACIYHTIRGLLGDELFNQAIHVFIEDNAYRAVETIDLIRAIEKATGRNLAFLFDRYVFRGGHPEFKVTYAWEGENNLAKITVKQNQAKNDDGELFNLQIPIAFGYGDMDKNFTLKSYSLRLEEREQSFYFPLDRRPHFFSFDVGNYFLKTVILDYPLMELKAQLYLDPDPISRIYAATALGKKGNLESVKSLGEALIKDTFWGVRLEVAKQLAKIKLNQSIAALMAGLEDQDSRVRRVVIESLSKFKTPETYQVIQEVAARGDESYYTEAAALRVLGGMANGPLKNKQTELLQFYQKVLEERDSWNEIIRGAVLGGLSQMKTVSEAVEIIAKYTQIGTPQPLRLAAIRALGNVSTGQNQAQVEEILELLETLATESFFLTQVAVTNALGNMQVGGAIEILTTLGDRTTDGRTRRLTEEAIQKVQKRMGSDKGMKQLRDEIEQLKQENQELKSRLGKLEAKS